MSLVGWAMVALILAFIAGGIGFSGVGRGLARMARLSFGAFAVAFLVLVVLILLRGGLALH